MGILQVLLVALGIAAVVAVVLLVVKLSKPRYVQYPPADAGSAPGPERVTYPQQGHQQPPYLQRPPR